MTSTKDVIKRYLDTFAAEIEVLVRQEAFRLVSESLGAVTTAARRSARAAVAGKPVGPTKTPKQRRGRASDNGERIYGYVKANPGARSEAVRASLKIHRGAWIYALNKLIDEKKIKRAGVKRASTLTAR